MNKKEFILFLKKDENNLTEKGIKSRITKANKAESILRKEFDFLDLIVKSDDIMLNSLNILQKFEDKKHNQMQNALRKYYKFKNGKEFPHKKDFE